MRRSGIVVLAVALLSCNALPSAAPKSPGNDFDRQVAALLAPNADVVDQPFEDLLAQLDLPKTYGARATEILDQIRKTRAAVATGHKAAAGGAGSRLASLAHSVGTFSVPEFAILFGQSLDALTKHGGTQQSQGNPYNSQETGTDFFTTTTLAATEIFTGSGAHVTGALKWSYTTITIEIKTGATVEHITDDRTLLGNIDVCPDTTGTVPASLDTSTSIAAQRVAGTTSSKSTGASTFEGSVNDQATLVSVSQRTHTEATTQSSSASGGYTADHAATWNANTSGDYLAGLGGSISGAVTPSGTTSALDAARGAGWGLALDAYALQPAYTAAQDLWRHGRCVMVTAPDYSAETPINTSDQEKPQNDKTVDPSSETKFSVGLKHRFGGGAISAATTASLSGEKTVTPNKIDGGSGSLTYKAPDEDDKKATLQLKSTSKRGIGTLVLDFHTGAEALTLSLTGTLKGQSGGFATSDVSYSVSIGPVEFKKVNESTWFGMGPWTSTVATDLGVGGTTQSCKGSESGTASMVAIVQTRGDKKVFVIDRSQSAAAGTGTIECTNITPIGTFPGGSFPSNGGSAGTFMGTLDDIVIPGDGGTIAVSGDRPDATGGVMHARGTAVATTGKKG